MEDVVPTIMVQNARAGMVLQFAGTATVTLATGEDVPVWEAEIMHVEEPDGLGDWGFWITPEGSHTEFFVWADTDKHYPIVS